MPTQMQIAEHLGLDQSAVSRHLERLQVDWRTASMDEIRLDYIAHLRAVAAGRVDENARQLTLERIETERTRRENLQMDLARKRGELVNAAQLEAEYARFVDACRSELLSLVDKIVDDIRTLYGVEVDRELVNDYIVTALSELAGHDSDNQRSHPPPAAAVDAAGADRSHGLGTAVSSPVE